MQELNTTAHKLLDVAEHLTQMHGFNAFSYKDLQKEVGVKTSSIHYYFPTKLDLAHSMVERYTERFCGFLKESEQKQNSGINRLKDMSNLYVGAVDEGKFCIYGMLASDMMSLPDSVTIKLCEFFHIAEKWLTTSIELAKDQGDIADSIDSASAASLFMAVLEGGMLIARARKCPAHLEKTVDDVLAQFQG